MFRKNKKDKKQEDTKEVPSLSKEELANLEFSEDSSEISMGNLEEEEVTKEALESHNELEELESSHEPVHPIVQYFSDLENKFFELESRVAGIKLKVNEVLEYLDQKQKEDK